MRDTERFGNNTFGLQREVWDSGASSFSACIASNLKPLCWVGVIMKVETPSIEWSWLDQSQPGRQFLMYTGRLANNTFGLQMEIWGLGASSFSGGIITNLKPDVCWVGIIMNFETPSIKR